MNQLGVKVRLDWTSPYVSNRNGLTMRASNSVAAIAITILLLITSSANADQWKLETTTDSMTDAQKRIASVTNQSGHSLSVYQPFSSKEMPQAVWLNFSLPSSSTDVFSGTKELMYRIDKNPAVAVDVTNSLRNIGIVTAEVEPKWINFLIWHGKEAEGRNAAINGLMSGQKIVFRYQLFTGGFKETSFDLAGAGSRSVIAAALRITENGDAERDAAIAEVKKLAMDEIKMCKTSVECRTAVISCVKGNSSDPEGYKRCRVR